jgi:hypothetical protein
MRKNNSRAVGNAYEREIRLQLIELGWDKCQTTRFASREMDANNVDLIHTEPFWIQCKRWKSAPSYHEVLDSMPRDYFYNVIFHKRPNKGEVVVMSKADFYELLKMLKSNQII